MAPYVNALLNNEKSLDNLLAGRKEAEVTNYDLMRVGFDPMSPQQKGFSFTDGRETQAHFGPYVLVTISRNKFILAVLETDSCVSKAKLMSLDLSRL